ncbi:uncharacterized protein TNCV_685791 [Trichonephila clavipes]|nr:uncharacterized protein TNCV_685791 [Trichonephila clavipes]
MEAQRPAVRSGIYCRAAYSNFTRCDSVGSNFLGHTIIFNYPLIKFDSSQKINGRYFNADYKLPMLSSHPGAIYQQDNAHPHTAHLPTMSSGYDVNTMACQVTNLSPIEHVWTRWEGNCSRPEIQEN